MNSFALPEVSPSITERERRTVHSVFGQLDNLELLDSPGEERKNILHEFSYLWHGIEAREPRQTLFETFILLKKTSLSGMPYSLLVIHDFDIASHLISSRGLEIIQSEFPELRFILCMRDCRKFADRYHQLILGKHQVVTILKELDKQTPEGNYAIYIDPNTKGPFKVHLEEMYCQPFDNPPNEALLKEENFPAIEPTPVDHDAKVWERLMDTLFSEIPLEDENEHSIHSNKDCKNQEDKKPKLLSKSNHPQRNPGCKKTKRKWRN